MNIVHNRRRESIATTGRASGRGGRGREIMLDCWGRWHGGILYRNRFMKAKCILIYDIKSI